MPKIMIQAVADDGDGADVTLSERVVAANLESPHYTSQLLERLVWATADAEALETQPIRAEPRVGGGAARAFASTAG
jgi:hypothetical protein